VTAFEAALSRWVASRLGTPDGLHVCIDGKTARGSKEGDAPGHHLVAAYAPSAQAVLAPLRVDAKTNEHKVALQLLGILPVQGCLFTGDAAFCQRDFCEKIVEGGGDYVLFVKDNQPGLGIDVAAGLAFEDEKRRQAAAFPPLRGGATAVGQRGAKRGQGPRPVEVVYGITSLSRERADAARLLELARQHWGIENGSHYRRDVTLGEAPSRVRKGSAPEVLAGLRNTLIYLVKDVAPSLATVIRRLGNCFTQALDLLGLPQLE
jgi:predicted transposase YbfD/YdcC